MQQVHAIVHAIVQVHAMVEKIAGVNGPSRWHKQHSSVMVKVPDC